VHAQVILGRQATHAHITAGLAALGREATAKDLVVLYVDGPSRVARP
jgi:hypothetical protein